LSLSSDPDRLFAKRTRDEGGYGLYQKATKGDVIVRQEEAYGKVTCTKGLLEVRAYVKSQE